MNNIKLIGTYTKSTETVTCNRLSQNCDIIPIVLPDTIAIQDNERLALFGEIKNDKGNVFVLIKEAELINEEDLDTTECTFIGKIKKIYPVRTTRKGKDLQDFLIEANGEVIKIVSFEVCPDFIKPGLQVHIKGRLQSRSFVQIGTYGPIDKTVYEVALKNLEVIDGE